MRIFGANEGKSRSGGKPTETAEIGEVQVSLWVSESQDGGKRFSWKLARLGEGGKGFVTFHPKHLVTDVLPALEMLASCFAKSPDIAESLRHELAEVASLLQAVQEARRNARGNGEDRDSSTLLAA
jgi:hypothetical protein